VWSPFMSVHNCVSVSLFSCFYSGNLKRALNIPAWINFFCGSVCPWFSSHTHIWQTVKNSTRENTTQGSFPTSLPLGLPILMINQSNLLLMIDHPNLIASQIAVKCWLLLTGSRYHVIIYYQAIFNNASPHNCRLN